ncbi:MAG: hypothetical protein ABI981_02835 [Betaproteobacteria bacterium]
MKFKTVMKKILCTLAALVVIPLMLPAQASAEHITPQTMVTTDATDLWWNPNESGWGLQVNQSGNLLFVTIFIYRGDGSPLWVTAQLTSVGNSSFTGNVFLSSGPYFGAPVFNPALVTTVPVGTMTFTFTSIVTATITYSISGVVVTKNIQRQPLLLEPVSGTYTGSANITASSCTNPANNTAGNFGYTLALNQVGAAINGSFQLAGAGQCAFSGTYTEFGRMGTYATNYVCPNGETGLMNFIEVTNRIGIISGRLSGQSTTLGCAYSGRFAVVNPLVP